MLLKRTQRDARSLREIFFQKSEEELEMLARDHDRPFPSATQRHHWTKSKNCTIPTRSPSLPDQKVEKNQTLEG
jgi:hypothetical protein